MNLLRPLKACDLPTLVALEQQCFADSWSAQSWAPLLADPQRFPGWLLTDGAGRAQGYLVFSRVLDEAELLRIGLAPEVQGKGLARTMLGDAQSRLEAQGVGHFYLEVRESNLSAQRLYRYCGWQAEGRRRGYYPGAEGAEDALMFSRQVD